jgi:hypothetical protein
MKKILIACLFTLISSNSFSATVSCNFITGDVFSKNFGWIGKPSEESILNMFTQDLSVELDNSLLAKLDTKIPFFVSEHRLGKIYIAGGDMGVEGRMVNVEGDEVTVWNGFCQVGFG